MKPVFVGEQVGVEVQRLFKDVPVGMGRVVITAYVGRNPVPLLGDVKGVSVYCSPSPSGTSAVGVLRLQAAGAAVYFSNALHMKVYWVEGRGALIGSANLSKHGLRGGLAEALVSMPAESVSIPALIASFKHPPALADKKAIDDLQEGNDRMGRRGVKVGDPSGETEDTDADEVTFPAWYASRTPFRVRLGWYDIRVSPPSRARDAARSAGFTEGLADFNATALSTYQPGEWILAFRVKDGATELTDRALEWVYVDGIMKLTAEEARDAGIPGYRHLAWQGATLRQPEPFDIRDIRTARALRAAWRALARHWKKADGSIKESVLKSPPEAFWSFALKHYGANP
jgi:hypothetical protein